MRKSPLCLTVAALIGCAAPRSDTQRYTETCALLFKEASFDAETSHVALPSQATLIEWALDYGGKLLRSVIEAQAGKFESSFTASTPCPATRTSSPLGGEKFAVAGYFVALRCVGSDDDGVAPPSLPRLDNMGFEAMSAEIAARLRDAGIGSVTSEDVQSGLRGALQEASVAAADVSLAFCATGVVRPSKSGSSCFIQLLAYTYPGLKAKQLAWSIPFTDVDAVKSALTLSLQGPRGPDAYEVSATFPLEWNAEGVAGAWWPSKYLHPNAPTARSDLLLLPRHEDLMLSFSVVESSDLASTLRNLADKADDYLDEAKSKLKDDDGASSMDATPGATHDPRSDGNAKPPGR